MISKENKASDTWDFIAAKPPIRDFLYGFLLTFPQDLSNLHSSFSVIIWNM